LPLPLPHREYLRAIRRGEVPLDEVVAAVSEAEAKLTELAATSPTPEQPDRQWVDEWLHRSYLGFWSRSP
jgi:hypothetical protein